MAKRAEKLSVSMLVLVTVIGIIIGSYLSLLIGFIPGDYVVVKEIFTFSFLPISVGYPNPISVDIGAIKFQFGLQTQFNLLSFVGIVVALYVYRRYR
ncbi:MAG: DUF4321 domain-containing protein [Chitinispirillales bacterium]|jgi:hypothetical protein|nr:DUF4321 domain-containing protein [Chitinispirillales bacterium]